MATLNHIQHAYFLGIGGIGMSALARYFNKRGVHVSGYDKTPTPLTTALQTEGISVHFDDNPDAIPRATELVIYTPAIPKDTRELEFLKNSGIPMKKRAEVLGMISNDTQTIAIAGTHGKTTTSSILAYILQFANVPSSAFLGGIVKNWNSNYVDSGNTYCIVEADEYDRSFLHLHPAIAVIGSLDADHLDIYGNREGMVESYIQFAQQISSTGKLFLSHYISDEDITSVRDSLSDTLNILSFGIDRGDCMARDIYIKDGRFHFSYQDNNVTISDISLVLAGRHNIVNATVAIAIALHCGVHATEIKQAVHSFEGIKRRFERVYESNQTVLIDDYAHHPNELRAAIQSAKELFAGKKITGIFQPHLYSRTRDFLTEFADVLEPLDEIILIELYPARETPIEGISSDRIFELIKNPNKCCIAKSELVEVLEQTKREVVVLLGAGDLDLLHEKIIGALKRSEG